MERLLQQGKTLSAIWKCPFFTAAQVLIDWLHCADLGISAEFLGSLFVLLLQKFQGNLQTRLSKLFAEILQFYEANNTPSKLEELTAKMLIKKSGAKPKLRGSAAEVRHLVPFAAEAALKFLVDDVPEEHAAKHAALQLATCYSTLSPANFDASVLEAAGRRFALLYTSLETCREKVAYHTQATLFLRADDVFLQRFLGMDIQE